MARESEEGMNNPENVIDLSVLGKEWTALSWKAEMLRSGSYPSFLLDGQCLEIERISSHFICEPPQVWIDLVDEVGQRWEVALEDDWKDHVVRARIISAPTHSSAPTP